ncbi:hypothetical protein QWA68_003339 [Fusarium oxysporum]|nr:hypothetical protein QWA68_003339 [Fusarium oxysporum]
MALITSGGITQPHRLIPIRAIVCEHAMHVHKYRVVSRYLPCLLTFGLVVYSFATLLAKRRLNPNNYPPATITYDPGGSAFDITCDVVSLANCITKSVSLSKPHSTRTCGQFQGSAFVFDYYIREICKMCFNMDMRWPQYIYISPPAPGYWTMGSAKQCFMRTQDVLVDVHVHFASTYSSLK